MDVRPMTPSDFARVFDWLPTERLNPPLNLLDWYDAFDEDALHIGVVDGEKVAACFGSRFQGELGHVGPVVVKPARRGLGYGQQIWQAVLAAMGSGPLVIHPTPEFAQHSERYGFVQDWFNLRMTGTVQARRTDESGMSLHTEVPLGELVRYDTEASGLVRPRMLQVLYAQPGTCTLVFRQGGMLRGVGSIRPSRQGFRIGPLFADDAAIAGRLFDVLCSRAGTGQMVTIDVPDANPAALEVMTSRGFAATARALRMSRGRVPPLRLDRVFGATVWVSG